MAQPKRRWSKARTGLRRSTWKLENKNLVECPHCHEKMMQHRVCPSCGYYDGKKYYQQKHLKTNIFFYNNTKSIVIFLFSIYYSKI